MYVALCTIFQFMMYIQPNHQSCLIWGVIQEENYFLKVSAVREITECNI